MSNLAERKQSLATRLGMSENQLELIRRMCVHPEAPDDVVELYLHRSKSIGVDPFDKMIYVIPRSANEQNPTSGQWNRTVRWTFQSSIDLFRSIAEDSGDYAGQLGPLWTADGVNWVDVWIAKDPPIACKVGVLRKSFSEPLWVTGTYDYYVQTDRDKKPTAFWKGEKGAHQLAKCVEELALRKAFPRKLHGLYGTEEMQQADNAVQPARDKTDVQDAAFEALPPAPPEDTADSETALQSARRSLGIFCSERGIDKERRLTIAAECFPQIFDGVPQEQRSSKLLTHVWQFDRIKEYIEAMAS